MKNIRRTRAQGSGKPEGRQGSFFSDMLRSASKEKAPLDSAVVEFDDMFKSPEEQGKKGKKNKRGSHKPTLEDEEANAFSTVASWAKDKKTGKDKYSTTTIEAMFGKDKKDDFVYENPLAQEVVFDVISSGGSVMKIARKLFLLEQLRHKSPADKSPDFIEETETDQTVEPVTPKKKPKKKRHSKVVRRSVELEGPVAALPKPLRDVAAEMTHDGFLSLSSIIAADWTLYTRMQVVLRISRLVDAIHAEKQAIGNLSSDSIYFDRNFSIFLAKLKDDTKSSDEAYEHKRKYDMLCFGAMILEVMMGARVQESDFPKLVGMMNSEKDKEYDEDAEDDYDANMLLSQEVEAELRKAFTTIVCVDATVELCVQLCSPMFDMRPMAEDAVPWMKETCKDVVQDDIKDSAKGVLSSMLRIPDILSSVVKTPEVQLFDEEDDKASTLSQMTNDSFQPPKQAGTDATGTQTNQLGDMLKRSHETETDGGAVSVSGGQKAGVESGTGERTRRRSLDRGYLDAKQKITEDVTANSVVAKDEFDKFQESLNKQREVLSSVNLPSPTELAQKFRKQERLRIDVALSIIKKARGILSEEPNLLQLDAPVMVVGDIHGQFFDLLNLVRIGGEPGSVLSVDENGVKRRRQYLFLGDYIDRGDYQCEVLLYLFSLKIKHPGHVWLLRGNHECRTVAAYFGFKDECSRKYGLPLFNYAAETFQAIPIAATISTPGGKFLCLHGGISPNVTSLRQFTEFDRFSEPAMTGFLCDVLWADPIKDDFEDGEATSVSEFLSLDYLPNPARGCSFRYGFRALVQFLAVNGLVGIIRAHEVQEEGYLYHFQEVTSGDPQARSTPPVITVFSAPNYCGRYGNKAAFMQIDAEVEKKKNKKGGLFKKKKKKKKNIDVDELAGVIRPMDLMKPVQFTAIDAPEPIAFTAPARENAWNVEKICPYMPTTFSAFIKKALELAGEGHVGTKPPLPLKEPPQPPREEEKEEEVAPPPVPPKLHGKASTAKKNPNWKALQMLGLDDTAAQPGGGGVGGSNRNLRKEKKNTKEHKEFEEAALNDSVMEMRPELIKGKVDEAVKQFEQSSIFQNLPDTIRLKEVAEAKRKERKRLSKARDGEEKITFTKEEITALQALFLLIDRKGVGHIDITDLISWSRDSGAVVHRDEAEICMQYVDVDNDGVINFKDYLVFAGNSKKIWLSAKYTEVMSQLNVMRQNA